jgi:chromosome segregation ATPase|eukprot:COSAG01_NODE_4375_length_5086_cov_128.430920_2_plen_221_part_00
MQAGDGDSVQEIIRAEEVKALIERVAQVEQRLDLPVSLRTAAEAAGGAETAAAEAESVGTPQQRPAATATTEGHAAAARFLATDSRLGAAGTGTPWRRLHDAQAQLEEKLVQVERLAVQLSDNLTPLAAEVDKCQRKLDRFASKKVATRVERAEQHIQDAAQQYDERIHALESMCAESQEMVQGVPIRRVELACKALTEMPPRLVRFLQCVTRVWLVEII